MKILAYFILVAFIQFVATSKSKSESSSESQSKSSSKSKCKLHYKYTLWIGDDIDEIHSIKLKSKCGIVFYDAMEQAAQKDDQFEFESTTHPLYGAFITAISGVANDDLA